MRSALSLAGLTALACAASCNFLAPTPDPSRYFTLVSLPPEGAPVRLPDGTTLGVGPIHVAEYLDRPAITVRVEPTEGERISVDRWAEPLDSMVARVIAEDLHARFEGGQLVAFPWYPNDAPHVQVRMWLNRLERSGDRARVAATWELLDPRTQVQIAYKTSE